VVRADTPDLGGVIPSPASAFNRPSAPNRYGKHNKANSNEACEHSEAGEYRSDAQQAENVTLIYSFCVELALSDLRRPRLQI
jgi:hypothetical protein